MRSLGNRFCQLDYSNQLYTLYNSQGAKLWSVVINHEINIGVQFWANTYAINWNAGIVVGGFTSGFEAKPHLVKVDMHGWYPGL